jgi:hypothetical protein
MGRVCSTNGREEKCIQISAGKPNKKGPLRISRRRWKDNIETDSKEVEC